MSYEFIVRIIGMIVLSFTGGYWGYNLSRPIPDQTVTYVLGFALLGALSGLLFTPYVTTRPARAMRSLLGRMSAESLFAGLTGLIVGLLIAALLAFPLSLLPDPLGQITAFRRRSGLFLFEHLTFRDASGRYYGIAQRPEREDRRREFIFMDKP